MRWTPTTKSTSFALWLVLMVVAETTAWFMLVPERRLSWTFVQLICLLILMFVIGLVSAMGGRPTPSIAEILNDAERPRGRRSGSH